MKPSETTREMFRKMDLFLKKVKSLKITKGSNIYAIWNLTLNKDLMPDYHRKKLLAFLVYLSINFCDFANWRPNSVQLQPSELLNSVCQQPMRKNRWKFSVLDWKKRIVNMTIMTWIMAIMPSSRHDRGHVFSFLKVWSRPSFSNLGNVRNSEMLQFSMNSSFWLAQPTLHRSFKYAS